MKSFTESIHPTKEILDDLFEKNSSEIWIKLKNSEKVLYKKIMPKGIGVTNSHDLSKLQKLSVKEIGYEDVCVLSLKKDTHFIFGKTGLTMVIIPCGARLTLAYGDFSNKLQKVNISSQYPSALAIGDNIDFSLTNLEDECLGLVAIYF